MASATSAKRINDFLLKNDILIKDNPAVSPDLVLNISSLLACIEGVYEDLASAMTKLDISVVSQDLGALRLYTRSELSVGAAKAVYVEALPTGDSALVVSGASDLPFEETSAVGQLSVVPLTAENMIHLKNWLLENDPQNTLFPKAAGNLKRSSLGIGARFTTLHWPAVAWAMSQLNLPVTANQNSIPRELVYDVDAMLDEKLTDIPFPFIGGSVPEGHQGQSVQGMSHASVATFLKYGFHKKGIVHGFNADHQPIGGRFDVIEDELVGGSLFASYITYDLSPELTETTMLDDAAEIESAFQSQVDKAEYDSIVKRLAELDLSIDDTDLKRLMVYLTPAMGKLKQRHDKYVAIREAKFTTPEGQAFYRELSIDELPGEETRPETLALCLLMAEARGIDVQYVAPNIGFQKNMPYPDNNELKSKIDTLFHVAKKMDVSFGFHSGSGKSAENYTVMGEATQQALEVKTSGRYTYEMGVALSQSTNAYDQTLWKDWYNFTIDLTVSGAFSDNDTQKKFAREFVEKSFEYEKKTTEGIFDSAQSLRSALESLTPSSEHMFWFEYNFLYVLAGNGSPTDLGNHEKAGYDQRKRFYNISDEGQLLFWKGIASYIIFLARTTGMSEAGVCDSVQSTLDNVASADVFLNQIG